MSRRSSAGDLVPKDITEILALQASKKKRGSSLSRAFSWFKGSKRKRSLSNGQNRTGDSGRQSGESITTTQIHVSGEHCKGQKPDDGRKLSVHYTAAQHYPENVFIEGCRPQYLEDLHNEAQEGLKILQQEEHRNGLEFQDDQSMPEVSSSRDRDDSLDTISTAEHSIVSASSVSAVSSRLVLTRQGSTFKPLNPLKKLDKTRRRSRRTTIMGIPQQVQKELDMAKGPTLQHLPNREHNGEDDLSGKVVIPTINGEHPLSHHEGARVHLQNIDVIQTSQDEDLFIKHIQSVYQEDDFSLCRQLQPGTFPMQRPKSLAVASLTTSCLQETQGPVMSISPQATYLSKIIPNAVLPAAIDIIEINRGIFQQSVSTISKGSPASSLSEARTSEGPPTTCTPNRSHSQSSETVVSSSSTISLKEKGPPVCFTDLTNEALVSNLKEMNVKSSNSDICYDSKCTEKRLEYKDLSDTEENVRKSSFSCNLSVMKTKLPPAPPQRTHSLHHDLKLNNGSKEWVDVRDMASYNNQSLSCTMEDHNSFIKEKSSYRSLVPNLPKHLEKSNQDSSDQAGSSSSSPQKKASNESKFDRTLSPSSGYSSQSGTPTHSPKGVSPSSPGNRRLKPAKPERAGVCTSLLVSVSSSMTSLSSVTSDTAYQDIQTNTTPSEPLKLSPPVTNSLTPQKPSNSLMELFNIPAPPKVKAPSPPPPETWKHNKCTLELLCGPGPNVYRLHQLLKEQKLNGVTEKTDTTYNGEQIIQTFEKQTNTETNTELEKKIMDVPPNMHEQMMAKTSITTLYDSTTLPNYEGPEDHDKASQSNIKQNLRNVKDQKKHRIQIFPCNEVPTIEVDQPQTNCEVNTKVQLVSNSYIPKCYKIKKENSKVQDIQNQQSINTLIIEVPEVNGISPPPSPPPAHHPPPPPIKPLSSTTVLISDSEEHRRATGVKAISFETSWPPPPPPMDESVDLIFEEQDELEFPPPPPVIIHEPLFETSNKCQESFEEHVNMELLSTEVSKIASSPIDHNIRVLDDSPKTCTSVSQISVNPLHVDKTTVDSQVEDILSRESTMSAENLPEQLSQPHLMDHHHTVNFKRQPIPENKDSISKELLSHHKNAPIPKEDANIPLVTPSLLQMVRLRAVNVEDQISDDWKTSPKSTNKDQQTCSQATPQKPIRKSLTLKSIPSTSTTGTFPSICLQEAIRMKTTALSSGGLPLKPNLCLSSTGGSGLPGDLHKSPASTASFIFSKSTKRLIIETATSPDTSPSLIQNLTPEITQVSDNAKLMITNGTKRTIKVPPPVAKKPLHTINPHNKPDNATTDKTECSTNEHSMRVNGQIDSVHPAGQQAQVSASRDTAKSE